MNKLLPITDTLAIEYKYENGVLELSDVLEIRLLTQEEYNTAQPTEDFCLDWLEAYGSYAYFTAKDIELVEDYLQLLTNCLKTLIKAEVGINSIALEIEDENN